MNVSRSTLDPAALWIAVQREGSPELRIVVPFAVYEPKLGVTQCFGRRFAFSEAFVELVHQIGRGGVVDVPEGRDHARRSGIQKGARQPDQFVAATVYAGSRTAGRKHDEVDARQIERR